MFSTIDQSLCKKSLVTRCRIHSLLVAKVARCKKSLVTCCEIRSLVVAKVACYKKSLATLCTAYYVKSLTRTMMQEPILVKFIYGRQN